MPHRPHKFRALSKPKHIHKHERRHYWPYMPLLFMVFGILLISSLQPSHYRKGGVLAYATSMSVDQLLASTNQQREQNGSEDLQLNAQLTSAAQAKANDMVARNYWSHNTPEGEEPWVFINNAGYKYLKAGENLAYGFDTSDSTIIGWMNSPAHRDNLLDTSFSEVGFGFANGQNFNNSGPETVVVAMYGKPQVLAASNVNQSSSPPAQTVPTSPTSAPAAVVPQTPPSPTITAEAPEPKDDKAAPVTTEQPTANEPATARVARVQTVTNGKAPWAIAAVGIVMTGSLVILLLKHAAGLRHVLRDGERFILHHPLLDTVLVSMVVMGSFLSQTSGFIR